MKIRKAIEQYINSFSTALNGDYVVEDVEITPNSSVLIIKYENLNTYKQETYNFEEYKHLVSSLDLMSFYFDKRHIVNLNDYPHWMIVGNSGSGKSFFAQELLSQAIIKGFKCYVLDPKRTYGAYRGLSTYISDEMDILSVLKDLEIEMNRRYKELEPLWDDNPRALAIDLGYKPIFVLVEEYSALQDGIIDKKEKEELKRIVRILSKKARQCSIHLCLVMQTGGVDVIESSVRSQFNKVLLGNVMNNILVSTFQADKEEIPTMNFKNKGEGLIQLQKITIIRVPNVTNIEDIKKFRYYILFNFESQ